MKRQIFILVAALTLITGAAFAQSTINTTAPGPTSQQEPGQTNNNLPNPGHPIPAPGTPAPQVQTGTSTGSMNGTETGTGMMPETETGSGMDVDVDTGSKAEGAVDVDVTRTTDADTDASGSGVQTTGQYGGNTNTLPSTASDLPTVALMGLMFLGAAFALRTYAKRNA